MFAKPLSVLMLCISASSPSDPVAEILEQSGITGGLVVQLGVTDLERIAEFAQRRFTFEALGTDAEAVQRARRVIQQQQRYGKVSANTFDGKRLPYIDNLVNLLIADSLGEVPLEEVKRVLAPRGVALIGRGADRSKYVKPWPDDIDEWTHYLHDSSNNAVAADRVAGPPRGLQWVAGPRFSRHHDKMSSMSGMVSARGRVFYIFDEAPRFSVLIDPQWKLTARDAFNGTVLWQRTIAKWHTHLWPLKSGPAQLPRRLVASGNRVYATLRIDGPVETLDAATGRTILTYPNTEGAQEIVVSDGTVFVVVQEDKQQLDPAAARRRGKTWKPVGWHLYAFEAESGKPLWSTDQASLPNTLAVNQSNAIFHNGRRIICLDRATGEVVWESDEVARGAEIRSFYAPTLVLYQDVVLFSGGEKASSQTGAWYRDGKDSMTALDARTGETLWTAPHPPSGYRSAEDLLVVDGLVWTGETTSGRAEGKMTGRNPRTGEVVRSFEPNVETYWFHHRCYRAKATSNFLLTSRSGIEFVDVEKEDWNPNHFVRGACLYGIMPANGMIYAPQHPCACYMEAKLSGLNALAPKPALPADGVAEVGPRLVKGTAYDAAAANSAAAPEDWPTFRHDGLRSGKAGTKVPADVTKAWRAEVGGKLTSPIVANGVLYVASVENHTVHAINAASGEKIWRFTAGGRVDSPPTYYDGNVYFGSADGWLYSLRSSDGALAWKFLAAAADRKTVSFDQLESVWPLHGSVLIENGVLYCVSGRSMFLDGGLRLWRLNPRTAEVLSETVLDEVEDETGKNLQDFVSWLNMPTGLPDVLSTDGGYLYMRSQPFDLSGKRLPLKPAPRSGDADRGAPEAIQGKRHAHLFSPTGFLDDSWWHRSYWMYGTMYVSGWQGYYRAGRRAPAGRILMHDEDTVYGFGRKPKYWKWTTPIEHHLFAAAKNQAETELPDPPSENSMVRIAKSKSLSIANTPMSFEAWVNTTSPSGAVMARGGNAQGISLFVKAGRPAFAVRVKGQATTVQANGPIRNRWAHLVGVLTEQAQLRLYVDGVLSASGKAPGLIPNDPNEAMEIGGDANTQVANYGSSQWFSGVIDQVRVFNRALSASEVADHYRGKPVNGDQLILDYGFDQGTAKDGTPNNNDGEIIAAKSVAGKFGRGLRFTGGSNQTPGFHVAYKWTTDLPIHARAMVLSNETIFALGPEDLVDEEEAVRLLSQPDIQKKVKDQEDAWNGKRGSVMWIASTKDGRKINELRFDFLPVFDGLVAAGGKLFVSTADGAVVCLE